MSTTAMNTVVGDQEMPLTEHLKELRSRMITAVVPIAILASIVFLFSGELLQVIWKQTVSHDVPYALDMNIYSPMELIITKFKLSIMVALFLGIPLMVYEAFMFVGKGLYENEKRFFIKIVPLSFLLFAFGAALAYFIAIPLIFRYTIFYSINVAVPQISVIRTISTITSLVIGFGLIFQFPLLLIFALKMNLLKPESLKEKRTVIYGILLAFAFFVFPDPSALSELFVAGILIVLFEFSLILAKFF